MDRSILYSQEQARGFDLLWQFKDALESIAYLEQDLTGTTTGVVSGFAATPTSPPSLTINIGAGRVYQLSAVDNTSYGSLASDPTLVMQQGVAAAQQVTLSTAGLTGGQSQWALIQAQFSQSDVIRSGDPTGGLLFYWNSANPSQPLQGPGGNLATQPTERQGAVVINVVYGAAATTGSEVPPSPTSGFVPLYMVDLTAGQTAITTGEILVAGPSVGNNVPTNYPYAPFVAGLLNSHHGGTTGQAPKIILTNGQEVQGVLPAANSAGIPIQSRTGTNYTYVNANIGNQVNRSNSGTAMFDTLPGTSPGQINATGVINIYNADSTALLVVSAGAGATLNGALSYNGFLILGPGQSANIISDGTNYWIAAKPDRVVLGANTTFYVSTTGSDTANSGLTSGSPFASVQMAWNVLQAHVDLSGYIVTIQLANGTYTAGLNAQTALLGSRGPSSVIFQGAATASNVTFAMVSAAAFFAYNGAAFTVQGMTLSGTGLSYGIWAQAGGQINFSNASFPVAFGAMGTGFHIVAEPTGTVTANAAYSISGGAAIHAFANGTGALVQIAGYTVTLSGTPGFSTVFAEATLLGALYANGITFSGSATGTRYLSSDNGVIYTNGGGANYFPGSAAGSTANGGLYL